MNDQERIQELEIKVSYLENSIEEISSTMLKQDRVIGELNTKLKILTSILEGDEEEIRGIEKPPHY